MSEKFLLIKINECPEDSKALMEKAAGNWSVKLDDMTDVTYMLVTCKRIIKAVYEIKEVIESDEGWVHGQRLSFDLAPTTDFSEYVNKELVSFTSNPSSILLESDVRFN